MSYTIIVGYERCFPWTFADWLINYADGFVRRGFFGQIMVLLSEFLKVNPGAIVLFFLLFITIAFFKLSWDLLFFRKEDLSPYALAIFSPFIFSFYITNPHTAVRKEIMFHVVLLFLILSALKDNVRKFRVKFFSILGLYPLLILSHELFAVYLPYILMVYVIKERVSLREIIKVKTIPVLILIVLSMVALVGAASTVPTDYKTVVKMVKKVNELGYTKLNLAKQFLTNGAMAYLTKTREYAKKDVLAVVDNYRKYYPQAFALAALAFIPFIKRLSVVFKNKLNILLFSLSLVLTAVLFTYARDWGRFTSVHLFAIFALSFLSEERVELSKKWKIAIYTVLPFYALLWRIPFSNNALPYKFINYDNAVHYIIDLPKKIVTIVRDLI